MSLAAALVLIAQAASPGVAPPAVEQRAAIAEQVRASVTVLRPARISVAAEDGSVSVDAPTNGQSVQRSRDAAGTLWVEFS
ncbi:MAG: hypothetical protein CL955_05585 [Erythrobacteraceae bacterium]|jgi:hypothetical protein|nr:hypothetical protein [Erythrobacteraceae bacterium]